VSTRQPPVVVNHRIRIGWRGTAAAMLRPFGLVLLRSSRVPRGPHRAHQRRHGWRCPCVAEPGVCTSDRACSLPLNPLERAAARAFQRERTQGRAPIEGIVEAPKRGRPKRLSAVWAARGVSLRGFCKPRSVAMGEFCPMM